MKYKIGTVARLLGVSPQTLRLYEQNGILTSERVEGENGYRYYSFLQSATLGTILMLRELNMSIPDIRAWMAHRSVEELDIQSHQVLFPIPGQQRLLNPLLGQNPGYGD